MQFGFLAHLRKVRVVVVGLRDSLKLPEVDCFLCARTNLNLRLAPSVLSTRAHSCARFCRASDVFRYTVAAAAAAAECAADSSAAAINLPPREGGTGGRGGAGRRSCGAARKRECGPPGLPAPT